MHPGSTTRSLVALACASSLGLLFAAALPRPADAQIWKKLKEKAAEAAAAAAARNAGKLVETVRCAVADDACIAKAKSEGKRVVLSDAPGQPASPPDESRSALEPLAVEPRSVPLAPNAAVVISDDGHHAGAITMKGSRAVVVFDGKEGPLFDEILPIGRRSPRKLVLSASGGRHAYLGRRGNECILVVDGAEGPAHPMNAGQGECPLAVSILFDEYGRRMAYVRRHDDGARLVVDGVAGPVYRSLASAEARGEQIFLRRGHVIYAARNTERAYVVVDGRQGSAFAEVADLQVTPDGAHHVYRARQGQRWHVVVDGVPGEAFDGIERVVQHATGSVAYIGLRGGQSSPEQVLVAGGERHAASELGGYVREISIGPDGKRLAFVVQTPNGYRLWVDGKSGPEYDGIQPPGEPWSGTSQGRIGVIEAVGTTAWAAMKPSFFSADGAHVGYVATKNHRNFVVLDGQEAGPFSSVWDFRFSPRGGMYTFQARPVDGPPVVVVNGTTAEGTGAVVFSPDGRRYALALESSPGRLIVDGESEAIRSSPFRSLERLWFPRLVFSPDGRKLAYVQATDGRVPVRDALMVDGETHHPPGSHYAFPTFSADGRHFAFAHGEKGGDNKWRWRIVVDGRRGPLVDDLLPQASSWAFVDGDTLRLLAVRDGMVHRVTIDLGGG